MSKHLLKGIIRRRSVYETSAEGIVGGTLVCGQCGYNYVPTAQEIAAYMREGWPSCVGAAFGGIRHEPTQFRYVRTPPPFQPAA